MSVFSENLRRARKSKGKTQQWMADQLHIHRSTYNKYEAGTVEPSLDSFFTLAKILEVDPSSLME